MATKPTDQGLAPETRDLIAAVLDAVDIPYAASAAHEETRARIMDERIMQLKVSLQHLAEAHDRGDRYLNEKFSDGLAYLRERLAEMPPTGYVTAEQARERTASGASWADAVRLDFKEPTTIGKQSPAGDSDDDEDGEDGEPAYPDIVATTYYAEQGGAERGVPEQITTVDVVQDDAGKRIEVSVYRGARPDVLSFTPEEAARAVRWWSGGIARGLADAVRLLTGDVARIAGAA